MDVRYPSEDLPSFRVPHSYRCAILRPYTTLPLVTDCYLGCYSVRNRCQPHTYRPFVPDLFLGWYPVPNRSPSSTTPAQFAAVLLSPMYSILTLTLTCPVRYIAIIAYDIRVDSRKTNRQKATLKSAWIAFISFHSPLALRWETPSTYQDSALGASNSFIVQFSVCYCIHALYYTYLHMKRYE